MKPFGYLLVLLLITLIHTVKAQSHVSGYIITNSRDTVECIFIVARKKKVDQGNNLHFTEIISGDSLVRLTSADLLGYKKGDTFYKSFKPGSLDTTFFARQITTGKVVLYYSDVFGGKYYFKKRKERYYYELDSQSESIVRSNTAVPGPLVAEQAYQSLVNSSIPDIQSNEGAYRDFFIEYFGDHQFIVNKLKQGFHTYSSIESMFIEYNRKD